MARFSALGEHGAVWLAIGAAGWLRARSGSSRRGWSAALRTVVLTYLANTAIKFAVRRPRPEIEGLPALAGAPTQLSFPSAHTSTSFAAALAYSRLGLPAIALYPLAGSLALSRLYLGLHYPSDLLAGAALGTALAAVLTGEAA